MTTLTYQVLKEAVAGSAAAFRLTMKLEAVSPKVFPATYEGGKYATEMRRIDGKEVPCVLLDSVQSQANRMELALQEAWETMIKADGNESRLIDLPVVSVDFSALNNPGVPKITSLQAPHRIADAILRDSLFEEDGKPPIKFRASEIGKELDQLSVANATPLLKYAPHCLVFGMWDSTGPRGGLGVKFARAMISEIIGVNAVPGVVTGGRIDPLNIRRAAGVLYRSEDGWTLDERKALRKGNEPIRLGSTEKKKGDGSPAEANHGNIPPAFVYAQDENKRPLKDENGHFVPKGGFTIDWAEQTTVLSLPALRRLRFPTAQSDKSTTDINLVARSYLAALALLGATLAIESGYDLRSRCVLRAKDPVRWYLLGRPGEEDKPFDLSREHAIDLYKEALAAAQALVLAVNGKPLMKTSEIVLMPTDNLTTLVKESWKLAAETGGENE